MNQNRMTRIGAKFQTDVIEELQRARAKFPSNKHMMGAFHEEVGEVAKEMLERDYRNRYTETEHNLALDEVVYKECVQAAAMAWRVATEGDPDYMYENPHYREMDDNMDHKLMPIPKPGEITMIDINEVQIQIDSNLVDLRATHQPTGCFVVCDKYDTQAENQAAALKELSRLVFDHLAWGAKDPQDDHLVIPGYLRRGPSDE